MVRLKRVKSRLPLLRRYLIEVTPPDATTCWVSDGAISRGEVYKRLIDEGRHPSDISGVVMAADQAHAAGTDEWVEESLAPGS